MRFAGAMAALVTAASSAVTAQPPRGLYRPDPTHFVCNHCSLAQLVMTAFGIKDFQLSGPGFLHQQLVDVRGEVPAGATQEQYQQTIRNLLETHVGMIAHRETRNIPALELVVAEGGARIRPIGGDAATAAPVDPFGIMPRPEAGGDAEPQGNRLPNSSIEVQNGVVIIRAYSATIAVLARMLW